MLSRTNGRKIAKVKIPKDPKPGYIYLDDAEDDSDCKMALKDLPESFFKKKRGKFKVKELKALDKALKSDTEPARVAI